MLWSTPQFGFVRMTEDFTSGSSIMPQKRNPDAAELVRGKSGRVLGHLQALLVALKGLPLAYSKDMQEDKEGVFDAADTLELCLAAIAAMLARDAGLPGADAGGGRRRLHHRHRPRRLAGAERGVPFRDAHGIAARAVKLAEERGCGLEELAADDLRRVDPRLDAERSGGAGRRALGRQPDQLRRHRARPGPGGGGRGRPAFLARASEVVPRAWIASAWPAPTR